MGAKRTGVTIRAARKRLHWSQADLAKKVRVTKSAVSAWERGLCFPGRHLREVAKALDLPLERLT